MSALVAETPGHASRDAGRILRIGHKARAALMRSGGMTTALPAGLPCGYRLAAGELIWVGTIGHALHPRAVLLDGQTKSGAFHPLSIASCFDLRGTTPWHPPRPHPQTLCRESAALREAGALLLARIGRLDAPRGFGALLLGAEPAFPLELGVPYVRCLAAALACGDVEQVVEAALPLLGFGPGLTPSGDDYVGAALFARRTLFADTHDGPHAAAWRDACERLADESRIATHAIGAALFGDLLEGDSFAPLHRLAEAVRAHACDATRDGIEMETAARELTTIGHSSGWDMLSGFITAIWGGLPDIL